MNSKNDKSIIYKSTIHNTEQNKQSSSSNLSIKNKYPPLNNINKENSINNLNNRNINKYSSQSNNKINKINIKNKPLSRNSSHRTMLNSREFKSEKRTCFSNIGNQTLSNNLDTDKLTKIELDNNKMASNEIDEETLRVISKMLDEDEDLKLVNEVQNNFYKPTEDIRKADD